jgi:hypothetical protein
MSLISDAGDVSGDISIAAPAARNSAVVDIVDSRAVQTPTEILYHELLYAVGNLYPNETRHETALRYIRKAETTGNSAMGGESNARRTICRA